MQPGDLIFYGSGRSINHVAMYIGNGQIVHASTERTGITAVSYTHLADKDPDNYEARAALMWGGSLSHNGLTGAGREFFMQVHQLEHELSGMYPSIAHGAGLAALWPSWARFVCPSDVNRFARYAVQVWNIDMDFDCPMNCLLYTSRCV